MLSALSLDAFVMGWSGEDALLTEAAAGFPGHKIVILHKAESYDGMSEGCPPGKKPFGSFRLVVLTDVPRVSIDKGVALFCGRRGRLSQGTEGEERHKTDPLRRKFAGQRDGPGKRIDGYWVRTVPVLLGKGRRLLEDGSAGIRFHLLSCQPMEGGTLSIYAPETPGSGLPETSPSRHAPAAL